MNTRSATTGPFSHAPTPTDAPTFARILELSSIGTDQARQARLDGARTLADFSSAGTPWLKQAPQWADVAALQQDAAIVFDNEHQAVASELWWRAAYARDPNGATATRLAAILEQRRLIDDATQWYVRAVGHGDYVAAARLAVLCDQAGELDLAHLLMVIGRSLLSRSRQRRSNDLRQALATAPDHQSSRRLITHVDDIDLLYYTACRILLAGDRDTASECLSTALLRGHKVAALTHASFTLHTTPTRTGIRFGATSIASRILQAAKTAPPDNTIPLGTRSTSSQVDTLVSTAIDGDRSAVACLLNTIQPLVVQYCRARIGRQKRSYAAADDVAQEICLAVLTALPSCRDQGRPFLGFVYGIAAHKVAQAHRSAARNRTEPVAQLPDAPELRDGSDTRAMRSDLSGRMARLLGTLPPKQSEILVLRIVLGLSAEETADAVGSTPGAVRVAQHRALSRLRKVLVAEEII